MDRSNVTKLVSISYTNGGYGKRVATETKREVFCSVESIDRAEFFAAFNSDLRPEIKLTMFAPDYQGEVICELEVGGVWIKYDIYRTYIKKNEELELWCTRRNEDATQTVSLYSYGKNIKLHGVYITGTDGANKTTTGEISTDTVTVYIPLTVQAFDGLTQVELAKPKEYGRMSTAQKALHFVLDPTCFFVIGDIDATGKYQEVNSQYDDVYRVQSVSLYNRGKLNTEYIEVVGK